jgi:hypothetical protein
MYRIRNLSCVCGYKFSEMWRGYDSRESQSDVKQTVNVDGLFVRSSTIKSI